MMKPLAAILLATFVSACAGTQPARDAGALGGSESEDVTQEQPSKDPNYWSAPGSRYPRRDG